MEKGFVACVLITTSLCLCQREVYGMITRSSNERHGMRRKSSPVKTIQSEDGDVIDCIHIYEQPSLHHPLLKNHAILTRPKTSAEMEMGNGRLPRKRFKQAWHKRGKCPKGTIPIVRSPIVNEERRIERLFDISNDKKTFSFSDSVHEFAAVVGKFGKDYGVFGATAEISVWNPRVLAGEFSCNMVSVASGDGSQVQESISAGWIVYDNLYGDFETRLFTYWSIVPELNALFLPSSYWTLSAGMGTGANNRQCFDMMCEGFIQVNPNVALGGRLPNSSSEGHQTFLSIHVYKDFREDWWLQINGELVGYWPSSLFGYLNFWANTTLYGGQIYNTNPGGYHTLTQMGSGHFADEGFGRSCMISHIQYANGDRTFKRLPDATIVVDRPECYSLVYFGEDFMNKYGQYMYNGGPGLSLRCM